MADPPIEIIRSDRRRRTVSAQMRPDGVIEVRAPAHISEDELSSVVKKLKARLVAKVERKELGPQGDEALESRAHEFNRKYFGGRLRWTSIRYSDRQQRRWGSCSTEARTIRLSQRLATLPEWVRDAVLFHEMAHLVYPDHSPAFWKLCALYPLTERARGYLMALDHMAGRETTEDEW